MGESSMNAQEAKLMVGIELIEDVIVEHLQCIASEGRSSWDLSNDLNIDYDILRGILRHSTRVVDLNPDGQKRAWTVDLGNRE